MTDDIITRLEYLTVRHCSSHKLIMLSRVAVGVIPPFGSLIMMLHCILLVCGIHSTLTQWIYDCSLFGFVAWIILSFGFGFCWVHRAFISYGMLVTFCIDYQRTVGVGSWLIPLRWLSIIIGIILFVFFIERKAWTKFVIYNIKKK